MRPHFLVGAAILALAASPANTASDTLLASMAETLLADYPENATFLGLDAGKRAALKRRLTDRSLAGNAARAASCAEQLGRLKAVDRSRLSGLSVVSYDSTLYAYQLAADGYAGFQYGDNAVLNTMQAESNTPYVVNQDTGDFSAIPDLLDSQHKIATAADADAYLSRLRALAVGLDAETERVRHDASLGVVAPDFLLDTTLQQMTGFRARPVADWGLVTSVARPGRRL